MSDKRQNSEYNEQEKNQQKEHQSTPAYKEHHKEYMSDKRQNSE